MPTFASLDWRIWNGVIRFCWQLAWSYNVDYSKLVFALLMIIFIRVGTAHPTLLSNCQVDFRMAYIKCKYCDHQMEFGFTPTSGCAITLCIGICSGILAGHILSSYYLAHYSFWYQIFGWLVALTIGGFVGMYSFLYIPWTIEWLMARLLRCPACSKRNWSFPFTKGYRRYAQPLIFKKRSFWIAFIIIFLLFIGDYYFKITLRGGLKGTFNRIYYRPAILNEYEFIDLDECDNANEIKIKAYTTYKSGQGTICIKYGKWSRFTYDYCVLYLIIVDGHALWIIDDSYLHNYSIRNCYGIYHLFDLKIGYREEHELYDWHEGDGTDREIVLRYQLHDSPKKSKEELDREIEKRKSQRSIPSRRI